MKETAYEPVIKSSRRSMSQKSDSLRWTTKDLMVAAVLSVALGLLYMAYSSLYMALSPLLGPVWIMLALGFYYLVGILVPYIIRKPGAAILASFLAAFTEMLAGSPFGVMAIWAGLCQGAGAEIGFAVGRWRNYRLPILILAAVLSAVFAYAYEYLLFDYQALTGGARLGLLLVRIPSAIVLAALLAKGLGDALKATGVLRGLAISRADRRS